AVRTATRLLRDHRSALRTLARRRRWRRRQSIDLPHHQKYAKSDDQELHDIIDKPSVVDRRDALFLGLCSGGCSFRETLRPLCSSDSDSPSSRSSIGTSDTRASQAVAAATID